MRDRGFIVRWRSAEHGFTLIEIMVALAVFSLAAMALIRLEGATIRGAATVDRALLARMVARNVAIEAVTGADPPPAGVASGAEANGGLRWSWTRTVRPTGDPRVVRVEVTVADPAGRTLARLTMIRPPNPPVAVSAT